MSPDPETQFRDAFLFLKANLSDAGLTFADVVEMTSYHVDLRKHLDLFIKVKGRAFKRALSGLDGDRRQRADHAGHADRDPHHRAGVS